MPSFETSHQRQAVFEYLPTVIPSQIMLNKHAGATLIFRCLFQAKDVDGMIVGPWRVRELVRTCTFAPNQDSRQLVPT
jgi:hypothetical protein